MLPVHHVRQPCETVEAVEEQTGNLPAPTERIHEKDVPRQRNHGIVHHVGVLEVYCAVLDVVAGVEKQLSVPVELYGLRRLVDLVSSLQILCSSLSQLSLRSVHDLVQVLDLPKASRGLNNNLSSAGLS